ncbi:ATP-binding protein [uncultured Brevundimonas sp.]|uniref:ATP-binding protein n=1 Tax=uncultured Brevundimonas sp. TaxID=213418 RepID=UPI002624E5B3|nr:ATP-binding protein [uncultured Brevundimonas sp.]
MTVLSHALWLIPILQVQPDLQASANPWLLALGQAILTVACVSVLRSHIFRRKTDHPIRIATITVCALTFSNLASITLAVLAFTQAGSWAFDARTITFVFAVPLNLGLVSIALLRGTPVQQVMCASALGGLGSLSILHGYEMAIAGAVPFNGGVPLYVAWMIAVFVSLATGGTLFAAHLWNGQRRFMKNLVSAINALPIGLALYDDRDRLLLWSRHYANLAGPNAHKLKWGMEYSEALKAGMKASLFPPGSAHDPKWLEQRLKERGPGDWVLQSYDGKRWIRLWNRRLPNSGMVTITSDITDEKNHEAELAEALERARSASASKTTFLATMSHEIRTPLNGIIAVTDALSRSDLDPRQAEMVQMIGSSSRTLQTLLSDILDLARIESGGMKIEKAPFDLACTLNETQQLWANAAHEKGITFKYRFDPNVGSWATGDAKATRQILNNLLSNAVKFTDRGEISLSVTRNADQVTIRVEDTGIGFDSANASRIFERFWQADDQHTRRFGGSGFGLAICAELAELMGGKLSATSQPGKGSTFTFVVPLPPINAPLPKRENLVDESINKTAQQLNTPEQGQALRILLADDNATNRRVVQLILDANNIQLVEVENGKEAVEAVAASRFDLVLMDMQMPVMDGLAATREIRRMEAERGRGRTPLIMLTANAMPEHIAASLEAGADAHLAKPFNVAQMLELTYNLTHNNQPA